MKYIRNFTFTERGENPKKPKMNVNIKKVVLNMFVRLYYKKLQN